MPGDPAILKGVPATLSAAHFLNSVAVKLPLFWPDNIETWFIQTESQFRLKGVVICQTKFDYCIQAMTQEVAIKVLDQRSKDIMECYCPHNSIIEEWWVIAVHLMKLYSFPDGFHVNIYITLQGKILLERS